MGRQIVMDSSGHTTFEFNPTIKAERDLAERRFRALIRKGYVPAFGRGSGEHRVPSKAGRVFNPNIEETIFIPALKGG